MPLITVGRICTYIISVLKISAQCTDLKYWHMNLMYWLLVVKMSHELHIIHLKHPSIEYFQKNVLIIRTQKHWLRCTNVTIQWQAIQTNADAELDCSNSCYHAVPFTPKTCPPGSPCLLPVEHTGEWGPGNTICQLLHQEEGRYGMHVHGLMCILILWLQWLLNMLLGLLAQLVYGTMHIETQCCGWRGHMLTCVWQAVHGQVGMDSVQ